jgi:hypothetical protein
MPNKINKHGLSRTIPEPVKRIIRQESYFGCVICGCPIITYEHIEPTFEDAKSHDPNRMTCLCGSCQLRSTKQNIAKETIWEAKSNPYCKKNGVIDSFDIGPNAPKIYFGFKSLGYGIIFESGENYFRIDEPEIEGGPFCITAQFLGDDGSQLFKITNNVWEGKKDFWDIELKGQRILFRTGTGAIALQIRCEPRKSIEIEKMNMVFGNKRICIFGRKFVQSDLSTKQKDIIMENATLGNCSFRRDEEKGSTIIELKDVTKPFGIIWGGDPDTHVLPNIIPKVGGSTQTGMKNK